MRDKGRSERGASLSTRTSSKTKATKGRTTTTETHLSVRLADESGPKGIRPSANGEAMDGYERSVRRTIQRSQKLRR